MNRILLTLLLCIASITGMKAQSLITGEVVDANREPLVGVTLQVKGTSVATVTDVDGKFQINAKTGDVILASYVGFKMVEEKVPASGKMTIIMTEDTKSLDEIVVVGVSMKKSDLTGAVSHIDGETLTEKPVTNINDALAGRLAGVSVGKASSPSDDGWIKIRGTNTINAGSSPIYVVDGLVMDNDLGFFNSLNINDVESIEVLKDASATALYGSRGSNGVIVITTKKGKQGQGSVTYDGWISWTKPGHRPKVMNGQQLGDLRVQSFANGYMFNNPDGDRNAYIQNEILNPSSTLGAFAPAELNAYLAGESYDWMNQVTQTGFQQNHNISFSKASDNTNIYLSLGLTDLDGVIKGTEQQKYWGRINASADIKPWLRIGTNTAFTYAHDEITDGSVYSQTLTNGNPLLDYRPYMDDVTRYDDENLTLFWRNHDESSTNYFNPFNTMNDLDINRSRYQITSSSFLEIRPIKDLVLRSTFGFNYTNQQYNYYVPTTIQQSRRYYAYDAYAQQQRYSNMQWQWDNTINYTHTWEDVHYFTAFIGTSASKNIWSYLRGDGQRFASDDLGYNGLFANADAENRRIYNGYGANTLLSYVARANYNYDYRYFVTVTGRYDGSSKFAPGHKWGFFPSFSLAWNISNEKFFPQTWWVNTIKLRGGYGIVGNQDIGDFMYLTLYNPTVSTTDASASYSPTGRRGTWDISWEKQKQTNIGIDLSFINNRINLTLDAYWIKNTDLLFSHSLPNTAGYSTTTENVGELSNKGFELTLNTTPILTPEFTWNFNLNFGLDRNKVTKLYGGVDRLLGNGRTGNLFVGQSLSNIYTYMSGGIANEWNRSIWEGIDYQAHTVDLGDMYLIDINGPDGVPDGVIDAYDRYIFGNTDPKFYGGFSTDLTWKGITINAIFDYSYGGHWISGYYEGLVNSTGTSMASVDLLDSWTPENTGAFFPRRMANAGSGYLAYRVDETDRYIQDTSYLRLSNLSISYSFPKKLLRKIYFDNLRIYFTASNVFCVTKYKGFDPYYGDGNGYFPTERSYTIGLSLTF